MRISEKASAPAGRALRAPGAPFRTGGGPL